MDRNRISKLPSGIIETILCLLPIQEAGRTSILSREWRYHWTKIPKLEFIENKFQVSTDGAEVSVSKQTFDKRSKRKEMTKRRKLLYAMYQVPLMHEGPLHEFILNMKVDSSCVEIDHIILHLSKKKTLRILKLDLDYQEYEGQRVCRTMDRNRISKLPSGIIETILCLLPIQEAGRTSILSREWRYHWTKIPKLEFIENKFQVSTDGAEVSVSKQTFDKPSKRKEMTKRRKLLYAMYQVLLMHEGPLHEFILNMEVDSSCVEIDHIILHLSKKKTLKILKLDLDYREYEGYVLPISLFSLHQLTELHLNECALFLERSFNKLGCVTTLYLESLWTYAKTLLRLLSSCPLLKRLTLNSGSATIFDSGDLTIVDQFKCLPVIEYLSVQFFIVQCFVPERLPKELPTTLVHLKCLCMEDMCFSHKYTLPFIVLLIRSSPNLEKLKLNMYYDEYMLDENDLLEEEEGDVLEGYSDIMLEHLNELEIKGFSDQENELDFVKLILAKSPVLKKARISFLSQFDEDEEWEISKILLRSSCASPLVKLVVG